MRQRTPPGPEPASKFCKHCQQDVPIEKFAKRVEGTRAIICNSCRWKRYGKPNRKRDPVKAAAQARAWRAKNRDHSRQYQRDYQRMLRNRDKLA